MKAKSRQSGLTLTEMVVVIAIIALLVGFGVPAGRTFINSFETESGTRSMISAALASARAVAAREQKYAGIRFQKAYDPAGLLKAPQYMIFIVLKKRRSTYLVHPSLEEPQVHVRVGVIACAQALGDGPARKMIKINPEHHFPVPPVPSQE